MMALLRSNVFLAVVLLTFAVPASVVLALRGLMRRQVPAALRVGAFFQQYGRVTFSAAFLVHAFGIFLSLGPWVRLVTALAALCLFVLWMSCGRVPSRRRTDTGRSTAHLLRGA
jgi:hypothetical protein